ncbi:MAG: cation transporter, partial [Rickettsiales bacterium]
PPTATHRNILWTVLAINASMFVVEMSAGIGAGSSALQADALDFLGDSASYIISLIVLTAHLRWRAGAALLKAASMTVFGLWVLGSTVWYLLQGGVPGALVMGSIGALALVANVVSAALLFGFRRGDSNMRSVWLCSRNDAIGNVAVILAAGGVSWLGSRWPDAIVAFIMAGLALTAAWQLFRHALADWRHEHRAPAE